MRTAQEMRAFAEQYKPDRLLTENPEKVSFETIVENLNENEEILFAFVASAGSVSGFRACRIGVAISKDRLLAVYKPDSIIGLLMGANCKTYNLKEVNSVGAQGLNINISIRAEGNILLGNWSPEKRNFISNEIRKIVDANQNVKENGTIVNNVSAAEELKKFKDLLDAGIITQEEFDAKKKQILGL